MLWLKFSKETFEKSGFLLYFLFERLLNFENQIRPDIQYPNLPDIQYPALGLVRYPTNSVPLPVSGASLVNTGTVFNRNW
jgi:hypothetical protein